MPKIPTTAQATKGTTVSWAPSDTQTRPTTGWIPIPGIVTYPKIGGAADSFESTTIDEDVMKTYVLGLLDPGGTQEITYNVSKETVEEIYDMYEARASGKFIFIKMEIPAPYAKNLYCTIDISPPQGMPEVGINGLLQDTASISYTGNFFTEDAA